MELNFSKKTRKIVASLLAVAILLGVLPVSGLTGNSSGAESSSSENSTKTIYVNSTKQPILFDSVGNFKEIIPKVKKNIYSTEAENGDKIALFTDIGNGNSVVFYKTTEWTPSAYMWKEDSSENPDKNAAWPGEAMKKYGDSNSSLYYYVYKSAKEFDKVIFNDGNDQNGDQTDNKDLKAWNVYTKTSAGRPICDSLTKCDVSDNFNVYEYADSKLSGKNISAPQGMGATIEIADKKYTVCGDGAKSEITCYEDDEITSLTANTVDGYTAKVTDSVVGDNQITYSVTYTNKTYGMQFSVENTVTFIKKPRLVLEGKWNVTFDGKPVNDGDTICKQEGIEKELKASFDIEKVTFKGTEITEGYETAITLNDNKFNSSCESSNLKDNNTLVVTVTYKTDKEDTSTSTFKFSYVEGNAVLEENDEDSSVYFEGKNIYTNTNKTNTNTNKDEITLKLTKSENVDDVTFSLRKGVSTPDSSNEIKDAVKREGDKVIIDNTKLKLSDIKKATLTLKSEKFGISDDYTLIYDTISKDNFTYSNTNENGRYFVNAHTGVTVTFNLVGIDEKLFNDENAEVTCGKENGVKISFDKDIKEWKATITKSDDYTFTFSNNGFVQTVEITDKDLYLDDTVPVVNSFKFEDGSSDGDKLLSFLTFGIYHNDKIKVTVTAEDPNEDDADNEIASSGVSSITLYNGENKLETKNVTENQAEFILSSKDGADTAKFNLYATATDNVGNESKYWTFDRVERISHENGREFNNLSSYDEPPTWDNFEVVATKENPEVIIKDEDITAIEGTHKYTDNDKMYFSSGANIKFKVTDEISGINSVKVYLDGDSESGKQLTVTTKSKNDPARYDQLKTKTTSDTFSCNTGDLSEGEHTIRIYAQNNSGNIVDGGCVTKTFYVDKTAPKVTSFKFEDGSSDGDKLLSFLTFGIYHNDKIKVTVTAEDPNEDDADNEIASSGVSSITLYNGENKLETKNVTENQAEFILSSKDGADTAKFNLYATATDNVGNESKYWTFDRVERISHENGREFNNLSSYDEPPTWDNFEVVATKENPEVIIKDEDITAIEGTHKYTDNDKMYFSSGANIKFKVTDEISGINSVKVYLDGDSESGKQLTVTTKSKNDPARYDQLKTKTTSDTFSCNTGDLSEGEHTIRIYAQNNSGNIVDGGCVTKTFYVDKTAPVITSFDIQNNDKQKIVDLTSEKQHYNYYFQTDTQVTVNADDNAEDKGNYSGIKTIYFRAYDVVTGEEYKSSKNVSTDNATASATFTVRANFKGELYAYAVDNVDNNGKTQHGEKKPDDLIVETQQHHNGNASVTMSRAKASYKDNSGLDLYSGNVNARVVFEDAYAGIKDAEIKVSDYTNTVTNTISVSVDNNGNITSSGNGSVTVTGTKAKNTNDNLITNIVVDYVVTDNSNNIKITTSMTDRAGNKTDNVKDSLSIDKTKPVIDVKYDNNEHTTYGGNDYYKADRTATVTVTERNFDESLVEAAIMRNSGRYTTIGGWTHNNNTADPDKSTHVAKIVYNTDGDFTFDIAVKDKAMNSADKFTQQKFTVDKTAPVIDVSFDNNSAKNGNYYKADRTATIKITEHNFNSGSQYVNIPVTAEGATAPSVVGWSGSGDDHNATVSFNKDGKYSFTVDYTDLAGNKAVQKKVDSFYIDKTAPEVEITGVADHQAYNGTVAPVVTYRDDNFTDDHDFKFTRIDINSKSDDTSKFDYDTDGNGVTEFIYKYRDFAEVLENDGIYNFTVELSDKAGNSTSKSVTFSVNRFGSTFKASDESEKLIKNGYTNAEQDIVVEEINVSPLTKHSVTLAKSGGNSTELVENTDYKFTSSNNGNEWCKSVYTVNKKNFSDEAAYTVTIMSVDKAKNTNNNRMADSSLSTEQKNKRECAISFVVDKTSPLVSITGIKDNELYKEASKKVKIVCEDDNLDKSKLVVTLDNKKLAEGEDYTIVDDKDGSIAGMLTAEIVLKAETGGIKENLKVTIGDLAGNTGEKSVDNFILSANIFQRFFANPVLVICTFAGLALVIAAVIFFVAKKRKKTE